MDVLSAAVEARARQRLQGMVAPVILSVPAIPEAQRLAAQLAADQPLLEIQQEEEGSLIALLDGWGRPTGIQFLGLPVGQELDVLLEAILSVSRGTTGLTPLGRAQAQGIPNGTEMWVLVTPSCPRCAQAARLASGIALESKGKATMTVVDVSSRPDLIRQFEAQTVPTFVVNRRTAFPGPLPELILLQRLTDETLRQGKD